MEVETVERSPMDLPSSAAIAPHIALQQCDNFLAMLLMIKF